MRRIIISLMALVLFSVQQVSAEVYKGNCGASGSNVTWSLDTETHVLTISGSGEMANWDVYNKDTSDANDYRIRNGNIYTVVFASGSNVTCIGNYAFDCCAQLTSITIPSTVTSIGRGAFYGCVALPSITIPSTVTTLGIETFRGCKSLTSISIPSSVTTIGADAFYGCEKLSDITFNNLSVSFSYDYNYFFYDLPATGTVHYPYGEDYTQSNFWKTSTKLHNWTWVPIPERLIIYTTTNGNALSLTSYDGFGANYVKDIEYIEEGKRCIAFDGNVTAIPQDAFKGEGTLSSIILPSTVTSIGSYAFQWDYNLSSINIPESVTTINYSVFNGCSSLSSIKIPDGVTAINGYTFYGCSKLASIDIPASVNVIGEGVFEGCGSLESISIPTGVTKIYNETFRDCSKLSSINIPSGVTIIGKSAFQGCSSLSSINIPDGVTVINDSTFKDCSTLPSITIPDGVTSIGIYAFKGCSKLSSIKIPSGVTTINDFTFSHCGELSSVDIPTGLTSIGSCAFQGCNKLSSIDIPEGVSNIGSNAFQWCIKLSTITLPSSMTKISFSTFNDCTGLTSINIPSSVKEIDSYAFYNCSSLSQIAIPSGVTTIYDHTFYRCSSLASIDIPSSVTDIKNHTFYGCSSLASIEIPSGVTSIGESAFYDCSSLKGITINFSVNKTTLGTDVFGGSTPSTGGTVNYLCGENYKGSAWWTNSSNKLQGWTWERIIDPNRVIEYTTNSEYAISLSSSAQWSSFGASKSEDIVIDGNRRYIIFDGNVTAIPEGAFDGNGYLTSIILSPTVKTIGARALRNCSNLTSVTLSRDLSSIAEDALHTYVNSNLSTNGPITEIRVTSPNNPIQLNDNVFKSVNSNCGLYVPMGLEYKYWNSPYGWDDVFGKNDRYIYGYTNFSVSADAKWGTCILSFDYALPNGVKAYKCNEVNNDGNLVLSDETTTIQRETPYILYAEEGCSLMEISGMYDQSSHSTIPEKVEAGKLTGALRTQTITSSYNTTQHFVLQNHADKGVKFYKTKEGVNHTVKPGRCWLTLSEQDAAFYRYVMSPDRGLGFEFDTTGVFDVHQEQTTDGIAYDLQGHRVTVMEPGRIYIVNGQKILKTK